MRHIIKGEPLEPGDHPAYRKGREEFEAGCDNFMDYARAMSLWPRDPEAAQQAYNLGWNEACYEGEWV
jgi:hypothetical protein